MAAVKGSKQYQMVVVPHRPYYRGSIFLLLLLAVAAFSWLTYRHGREQGLAMKVAVVKERDAIAADLDRSLSANAEMRQQIADLKLGEVIDSRANEEIRQTVEGLQSQVAELNEEIRFYKSVMLPNVENKGLRIERLDVKNTLDPNKIRYSLLLTQVVDKHEYVQGGVEISVIGLQGGDEKQLSLDDISGDGQKPIRFRFRYFQNIDGEMTIPSGFEPTRIMVVAQSSGRNGQRLERKFDWMPVGG